MFEMALEKAVKTYKWMKKYENSNVSSKPYEEYQNKLIGQVELMEELFDIDSEDIYNMVQDRFNA